MFSRWRSAIYSDPPFDFLQPREAEAFTLHRSPTVLRAIPPIRFPVNPHRRRAQRREPTFESNIKHPTSNPPTDGFAVANVSAPSASYFIIALFIIAL